MPVVSKNRQQGLAHHDAPEGLAATGVGDGRDSLTDEAAEEKQRIDAAPVSQLARQAGGPTGAIASEEESIPAAVAETLQEIYAVLFNTGQS